MKANWSTPSGRALAKLAAALLQDRPNQRFRIKVFGSGILQLFHDPSHLSADVDVEVMIQPGDHPDGQPHFLDHEKVVEALNKHHLGKGQAAFYIEVPDEVIFKPGRDWRQRCQEETLGNVTYVLPDIIDILIAKLQRTEQDRFESKDMASFLKIDPAEEQMLNELLLVEPGRFCPLREPLRKNPFHRNIDILWQRLYSRTDKSSFAKTAIIEPMIDSLIAASVSESDNRLKMLRDAMTASENDA